MSKFFINRPIVAIVISIVMVILGTITIVSLPVAQFPNIAPPEIQIQATYVGRGRADAGAIRRHADRTANERRGQHELHVFVERHGQWQMTMIVDFDVKTDPNTDQILAQMTRDASGIAASGGCQQLRSHGAEVGDLAADADHAVLAERNVRRGVSCELRVHQSSRSVDARPRNRQRADLRRRTICDALVGEAGSIGQAGHHRHGHHQRDPGAEHRESRRTGGRRASSQRAGVHLLGSRARTIDFRG